MSAPPPSSRELFLLNEIYSFIENSSVFLGGGKKTKESQSFSYTEVRGRLMKRERERARERILSCTNDDFFAW